MSETPGKRLILLRETRGMTQVSLAAALGVSRSTVAFIEADDRPPSRAFLQRIGDKFGISADWLLNGHGDMMSDRAVIAGFAERLVEPPDYSSPGHGDFVADGEDYSLIERADISVSAGNGIIPIDGGASERLAFSSGWLRREGINPKLAVLVRVRGDSMAPLIPDGALVLVHLAEITVDREGVYAFTRGDEAFVKRLIPAGKLPSGQPSAIIIASDNRSYPADTVSGAAERSNLRVIGRVRCVMTTL